MRVVLDEAACTGHGRCYALAPSVFGADELGRCEVLVAEPTGEDAEAARVAVASCPEDALGISDR